MLGDIFLRFTTQLRAYTNFLNNYPVTLQTLERVRRFNIGKTLFYACHRLSLSLYFHFKINLMDLQLTKLQRVIRLKFDITISYAQRPTLIRRENGAFRKRS